MSRAEVLRRHEGFGLGQPACKGPIQAAFLFMIAIVVTMVLNFNLQGKELHDTLDIKYRCGDKFLYLKAGS